MTRPQIEERKAMLIAERDRLLGQINGVIGAIAECDHWLAEIARAEEAAVKPFSPKRPKA